jgi:NAD(P)-dependent dehydrogenase (short-subunit alcohol dehydrogenase family)
MSAVPVGPSTASLAGRNAVVTGAAQGIGAAIARGLAAYGADVAICDRNEDGLATTAADVRSAGRRAVTGVLDVRDADAVAQWVTEVDAGLGPIDVLVNNAGGGFWSAFLDVRAKGQTALVDENFTSVTHFIRGCVPLMPPPPRGGSIINITSIEAFRAAPGFAIYAAMKAAVESLTKSLALELVDRGIRVNCIAPDAMPTEGDTVLAEAVHGNGGGIAGYGAKVPLGLGHVDDAAAAAVFLAGDLSRFVTGTTVHVDGGTYAASGWHRGPGGNYAL